MAAIVEQGVWSTVSFVFPRPSMYNSEVEGNNIHCFPWSQSLHNATPPTTNQSDYGPLNLENGSFVNSDNFDAPDLRF